MKKLIVKIKVIDIPYSPAIEAVEGVEAQPEKWVRGEDTVFEAPEDLTDWIHHPAIEGVEAVEGRPEQPEVSHEEIIAQTQGSDGELAVWIQGDMHKYPEGYWVEYIDISAQLDQERINAEALQYLADTDWLIIREVDAGIACPLDIKQLRAEARSKIVR